MTPLSSATLKHSKQKAARPWSRTGITLMSPVTESPKHYNTLLRYFGQPCVDTWHHLSPHWHINNTSLWLRSMPRNLGHKAQAVPSLQINLNHRSIYIRCSGATPSPHKPWSETSSTTNDVRWSSLPHRKHQHISFDCVLWKPWSETANRTVMFLQKQGLSPCAAKYPPTPHIVWPVILHVKVLLSVYAHFVVLGLVIINCNSAHLVWLSRDQWHSR